MPKYPVAYRTDDARRYRVAGLPRSRPVHVTLPGFQRARALAPVSMDRVDNILLNELVVRNRARSAVNFYIGQAYKIAGRANAVGALITAAEAADYLREQRIRAEAEGEARLQDAISVGLVLRESRSATPDFSDWENIRDVTASYAGTDWAQAPVVSHHIYYSSSSIYWTGAPAVDYDAERAARAAYEIAPADAELAYEAYYMVDQPGTGLYDAGYDHGRMWERLPTSAPDPYGTVSQYVPVPRLIPGTVTKPRHERAAQRTAAENSARGPALEPVPYTGPVSTRAIEYSAAIEARNVPVQNPAAQPVDAPAPGAAPSRGTHRSRPPEAGTKEKKWVAASHVAYRLGAHIVGGITEAADMTDALWWALPKSQRSGYYKLHYRKADGTIGVYYKFRHKVHYSVKLADIARGYTEIDLNEALNNLAVNALIDMGVGKLNKKVLEFSRPFLDKIRSPVGPQFGPGNGFGLTLTL